MSDQNIEDLVTTVDYNDQIDQVDNSVTLNVLRAERNKRLAETDYMALNDVTMSDAWRTYRQELRDITNIYMSINDVVWPEKPE